MSPGTLVELGVSGNRLPHPSGRESHVWLLLIFVSHPIFEVDHFMKRQNQQILEFSKLLCVRSAKNHLL